MRTHTLIGLALVFGFLVALTLFVLVPASPLFQQLPSWDSGVFLYTGWRLTQGDLLYLDVWDHKPPLVFVINAVGVMLGGGSRWGVWAIEFVLMLVSALLAFSLIRRAFGNLPAVYGSVAWLVNAFVTMDGGNYTTEYGLPLQFGLLWLVGTAPASGVSMRRAFVLGILSALLFWLKQNDIGIPLALVLVFALDFGRGQRSKSLQALMAMIGGAALVSALVILPFLLQRTLAEFWDAAFLYNFEYIGGSWIKRLISLRVLPMTLPAMGLTTLALVGWLIAALAFLNGLGRGSSAWNNWCDALDGLWGERTNNNPDALTRIQVVRLLTLVLIALPIECFLVALSGSGFDHYFLALLPVFSVLAAFTFRILLAALERAGLVHKVRVAFVVLVLGLLVVLSTEHVRPIFQRIASRQNSALIASILANTDPQDRVMIWGGETRINFLAKRVSAMRYAYTSMLRPGPSLQPRLRQAMTDLRRNKPRWIIQEPGSESFLSQFSPAEPEIVAASKEFWQVYELEETVNGWSIYESRTP